MLTDSHCSRCTGDIPFLQAQVRACSHIRPICFLAICRSTNPLNPSCIPSFCFPRKSNSGPQRAVAIGKAFLHQSNLTLNATVTPPPPIFACLSLHLQGDATAITAIWPHGSCDGISTSQCGACLIAADGRWGISHEDGRGESAVGFCHSPYTNRLRLVHAVQ